MSNQSIRKEGDVPITSEIHKHRCPIDGSTQFYFTEQGISQRCRHCKGVQIVPWSKILREYANLCVDAVPQD